MPSPFTEYLGIVIRTHGLDGEFIVGETTGLSPALKPGDRVGIGFSREFSRELTLEDVSITSNRIVFKVRGFNTKESVEELIDKAVYITSEHAGTEDKERFAVGSIEGCAVLDESGSVLGTITEVLLLPANDVWVLTLEDGGTIPLPVIDDVIKDVDLDKKKIVVELLDGLDQVDVNSPEDHDA